MALESFNTYFSYLDSMELLTDEECGRLYRAMLIYASTGVAPELKGNERFVFPAMRAQIDRDAQSYYDKCERNRKSVKKRYENDAKTTDASAASDAHPANTNAAEAAEESQNLRTHTNVYERSGETSAYTNATKDKDKDKDKDKSKKANSSYADAPEELALSPHAARARFQPPDVEAVRAYCQERGNGIDAQSFCDYYAARGWMAGKSKMRDWRAAVRTWEGRSRASGRKAPPGGGNPFLEMLHEEGYDGYGQD